MAAVTTTGKGPGRGWLRGLTSEPQHRDTLFLTLNTVLGAATGLLFWVLFVRVAHLPPEEIGAGFAIVGLGTVCGVIGKGGLDTALLRSVPVAGRIEGLRLLRFAIAVGVAVSSVLTLLLVLGSRISMAVPRLGLGGWALVAAIGGLLVVTWLQDAHFLAEGSARPTFHRNVVFAIARLALPLPVVWLAWHHPVPLAWALALLVSALVARLIALGDPFRDGRTVPRGEFLVSAARNVAGSSAEFLPGLLLAPLVMAVEGPEAAAYFGFAWTAAAILYLVTAAIGRSALSRLVRGEDEAVAIRRAVRQMVLLVAPAVVAAVLLAPYALGLIGPDYAREGAPVLIVLSLATLFVAPFYLYLAVLRARGRPAALVGFPAAMILGLLVFAPLLGAYFGHMGVAYAWLLANLPCGVFAAFRLRQEARGVMVRIPRPAHGGHPHLE